MLRYMVMTIAVLGAPAIAASAAAEPASCVVNLAGKGSYSGPCELDRGSGGSFEIATNGSGVMPGGATRLRVSVVSPRRAMLTGIAPSGTQTQWGAVRQAASGCWLGMTQSVCVDDASGASLLTVAASAPQAPTKTVAPVEARTWTAAGRLRGVDIGDNAWLEWTDMQGKAQSGICSAAACQPWFDAGQLPRALVGKPVRLVMKAGKAMSGDVVMADADEIIGVEFIKPAKKRK